MPQWQEAELYHLGVTVKLNTFADANDVLATSPAAVIIATGSRPRMDGYQLVAPDAPIRGFDQPHVLSSIGLLMSPPANLGRHALVLDNVGHFEAISCAIHLIQKGLAVTYVTHQRSFAPYVQTCQRDDGMLELAEQGDFTLLINHVLLEIRNHECVIRAHTGTREKVIPADTVVLVTPNEPNRELYDALSGRVPHLAAIGDALSPRDMLTAIREGHRAVRATQ